MFVFWENSILAEELECCHLGFQIQMSRYGEPVGSGANKRGLTLDVLLEVVSLPRSKALVVSKTLAGLQSSESRTLQDCFHPHAKLKQVDVERF